MAISIHTFSEDWVWFETNPGGAGGGRGGGTKEMSIPVCTATLCNQGYMILIRT